MEDLGIIGNTPFERAQAARIKAHLLFATHQAVKDLVNEINQCDEMIRKWEDTVAQYNMGEATKADLETDLRMATEALKDKKLFESALVMVSESAARDLGLEA